MLDEYKIERKRFWWFIVNTYLKVDNDLIKTMKEEYIDNAGDSDGLLD
jgi:hypothetical protein